MSVIDKERLQPAIGVFQKERLPVVGVPGTDVNQPCQPEALTIADSFEAGSRQNFQ
jgi:hypothetical protein